MACGEFGAMRMQTLFGLGLVASCALGCVTDDEAVDIDEVARTQPAVGLSLWFENGAVRLFSGAEKTVDLYEDFPRYVQELDITAQVDTTTDQGVQPLLTTGDMKTLDWRGLQGLAMRERQLAPFEAQDRIEDVRGLLRAILECHFNRPSSAGQPTHMFFLRLLMEATPEIAEFFREASVWFRNDVLLLQRARPEISFEDACWRYYAIMGLTHLSDFDGERLKAWSGGRCDPDDRGRAFDLIVDSAIAILMMPPRRG